MSIASPTLPESPLRLVHVITGLNPGGAETMCVALACRLAARPGPGLQQAVVSLLPEGPLAAPLLEAGIPVISCNMTGARDLLRGLGRLRQALGFFRPQVVQSWMYHADLLASLALRLPGAVRLPDRSSARPARPALVWGLHNGSLDPAALPASTRTVVRLLAWGSPWLPDAVISCAESAAATHRAAGFRPKRWEIIPNGVDVARFKPDPALRQAARSRWNIPDHAPVLGLAARDHPVKDLPTFVQAVAQVATILPEVRCVCCGAGMEESNPHIAALFRAAGLGDRTLLLGLQQDMPAFWNGVDVAVSSSMGEALPLGLAEAMACGVPVAATAVGDTARLVGEAGIVVPPTDPAALAGAMVQVWQHRAALRGLAQTRILEHYALEVCATRYAAVYAAVS